MGQSAEDAGALHEGVPAWMERALWRWIDGRIVGRPTQSRPYVRAAVVDKFEQLRRAPKPATNVFEAVARMHDADQAVARLRSMWDGEKDVIPFVDFLVVETNEWNAELILRNLEDALLQNGSAWKVGSRDGHPGLERRVPLGVQEVADHAMASAGRAGERLSEAWHATFGVSPNPTLAYALAVRAVEDATIQLVVPNQKSPTLGHVIGQLKNDGDWRLPLTREDPSAPTSETIVRMAKALWKGHHDRHGGDSSAPKSVSLEEAETAVLLAVSLVHWFNSGAATRR